MKSRSRNKNVGGTSASRRRSGNNRSRRKGPSHISRPFVSATFAMTVDGKVTTRDFTPVDFTSREDKQFLFQQRALADAVIIGHSTLKRDNVKLGISEDLRDARIKRGQKPAPLRVIISNQGKIDSQLKIFQSEISPILIFSTKRMSREVRAALLEKKVTLHLSKAKDVDLRETLGILRRDYNVRRVACEGGPILFRSMLELGLIDELNLTIAPYLFGGADAPTLTGLSKEFLSVSVHCVMKKMRVVGDECFLTYRIKSRR
ncbi:MAG TPA: RibD family protein [Chthoniobacterales bacterium]|nr:RibD family protein [Chthoniobacterales bacterium]